MNKSIVPSRNNTIVRRSTTHDVAIMERLPSKHCHALPVNLDDHKQLPIVIDDATKEWISHVEEIYPILSMDLDHVKMPPAVGQLPIPQHIRSAPNGKILIRIASSRLNSDGKTYHLMLRVRGDRRWVTSCPAGRSGSISDYFLLPLPQRCDFNEAALEILVLPQTAPAEGMAKPVRQAKSLKTRASELLHLRSHSKESLEEESIGVILPLALFWGQKSQHGPTADMLQFSGTYFLLGDTSNRVCGEVTLQILVSPESLVDVHASPRPNALGSARSIAYQGYLTISDGPHHWDRRWGVLRGRELQLYDFQRRGDPDHMQHLDLLKLTKICFAEAHPMGLRNVLSLRLEGRRNEIYVYADSKECGIAWTDAVHRAIWNQPYAHISVPV